VVVSARSAVTFDDWDACAKFGDCDPGVSDNEFKRGRQPVINVAWDDATRYVAWLSRMTGKPYRLLSEAEFEYAARAGTQTAYPWGADAICTGNANCAFFGSALSREEPDAGDRHVRVWNARPVPVGSFAANQFGLHDMHGNVWQWVEDCYYNSYQGAPDDGSAWTTGPTDCHRRVSRGGSWLNGPRGIRSASRRSPATDIRDGTLGFRVGRTLTP
jgi:formylglycine-generating enzyme required for sulfatase activity